MQVCVQVCGAAILPIATPHVQAVLADHRFDMNDNRRLLEV